jgi:replication-associated recombination protein RarA
VVDLTLSHKLNNNLFSRNFVFAFEVLQQKNILYSLSHSTQTKKRNANSYLLIIVLVFVLDLKEKRRVLHEENISFIYSTKKKKVFLFLGLQRFQHKKII